LGEGESSRQRRGEGFSSLVACPMFVDTPMKMG
jgi:hypothetical protein